MLTEDMTFGDAAEVANAGGAGVAVLICEHASHRIPEVLNGLGLAAEARESHVAWDPGARQVAGLLSAALDAPLVSGCLSRLVYDCNRAPEASDAIPEVSERFEVPGNAGLAAAARAARVRQVFEPFSATVSDTLDARARAPVLVTIHSFTPVYMGTRRRVEIGVLHDCDTRLADAMLASAARHTPLIVGRNDPYGPEDGVTYTLRRHAIPRNLPNVMIEIRNDLLRGEDDCRAMAAMLADWLLEAMRAVEDHGDHSQ